MDQPSSIQIHDFNPGITPSGLFWTVPSFPDSNVHFDFDRGTASMHAREWSITDYHDFRNSLGDEVPPIRPIPGKVSFDVNWTAKAGPTPINNSTDRFRGTFRDSNATVAWTADEPAKNFRFVSARANTSTTVSGVIGHEFNGKFY